MHELFSTYAQEWKPEELKTLCSSTEKEECIVKKGHEILIQDCLVRSKSCSYFLIKFSNRFHIEISIAENIIIVKQESDIRI